MEYKIHYAKLDLQGDIPCNIFNSKEQVISFVSSIVNPTKFLSDKVFLLAIEDEIIISENRLFILELFEGKLNSIYPFYEFEDIFIQEYSSYEDAYNVALDMREPNKLCYKN